MRNTYLEASILTYLAGNPRSKLSTISGEIHEDYTDVFDALLWLVDTGRVLMNRSEDPPGGVGPWVYSDAAFPLFP